MERKRCVIGSFVLLVFIMHMDVGCAVTCSQATEYNAEGRCCPLCETGTHVSKHCTQYTGTSCEPCPGGTFLDQPSGRTNCFACNNCSAGPGLREKSPCTPSSNAVCEPSEGFYCVFQTENGCFNTKKHSSCSPGQYIIQKGTASTDTVCASCTGDTYSDGTFTSCQPHTDCALLRLHVIKPGNHANDSTCGESSNSQTITGFIGVVVVVVVVVVGGVTSVVFDVFGVGFGGVAGVLVGVIGLGLGFGVDVPFSLMLFIVVGGGVVGIVVALVVGRYDDDDDYISVDVVRAAAAVAIGVVGGFIYRFNLGVFYLYHRGSFRIFAVSFHCVWLIVILFSGGICIRAYVVGAGFRIHDDVNIVHVVSFFGGFSVGVGAVGVGGHDFIVGLVVAEVIGVGIDVGLVILLWIKRSFLDDWCHQRKRARRRNIL